MSRDRNLVIVNVALGGVVLILGLVLALRGDPVTAVNRDDLPRLYEDFPKDSIRRIELTKPTADGKDVLRLELRGQGRWELTSHYDYPTRAGAQRLLDAIADVRLRGEVTQRKETFEQYAGEHGWTEIKLTDVQGRELLAFGLGKYTYPETFLRVGGEGQERIVRALNISPGVARTDLGSWIETRLWPELTDQNAVKIEIEQRRDKRTLTFEKRDVPVEPAEGEDGKDAKAKDPKTESVWFMTSPKEEKAKKLALEDLLREFTGMRLEEIAAGATTAATNPTQGFDDPELIATFHHKDDQGKVHKAVLTVGKRVEGSESWYVQRAGARWVFVVSGTSVSRMRQLPGEFLEAAKPAVPAGDDDPKKDAK